MRVFLVHGRNNAIEGAVDDQKSGPASGRARGSDIFGKRFGPPFWRLKKVARSPHDGAEALRQKLTMFGVKTIQ